MNLRYRSEWLAIRRPQPGHSRSCPDPVRGYVAVAEASDAQGASKEFYGSVDVRDHPADLGQLESDDGVADTVHVCLLLA